MPRWNVRLVSKILYFIGSLIKSTFDSTSFDSTSSAVDYAKNAKTVCDHAKTVVRDLDPSNELMFLRIGTKKKEIIMTPGKTRYLNNMTLTLICLLHVISEC